MWVERIGVVGGGGGRGVSQTIFFSVLIFFCFDYKYVTVVFQLQSHINCSTRNAQRKTLKTHFTP